MSLKEQALGASYELTNSTWYMGTRHGGAPRVIKYCADMSRRSEPLQVRLDLVNHSPDGFEWGYGGSGPAQLAIAILADAVGDSYAVHRYQEFKRDVVQQLEHHDWLIEGPTLLSWIWDHPVTAEQRSSFQSVEDMDREIAETIPSECCRASCEYRLDYFFGRRKSIAICTACGREVEF